MKEQYIRLSHIIIDKTLEYRSYFFCLIGLLTGYFAKSHVTELLRMSVKHIEDCSEQTFAVVTCLVSIVLSLYLLLGILEQKKYIAHSTIATTTFFVVSYLYYRIIDDTFVFWGISPCFAWLDLLLIPYILLVIEKCQHRKHSDSTRITSHILCDNPIDRFDHDAFGHRQVIVTMLDNLKAIDLSKRAYSVGIVGEWGQGKSSFLNLFSSSIQEDVVVRFNPRSVKSVDKIQEEFFTVLAEELSKYHTGVKRYIRQYAIAIEAADDGWVGKLANIIVSLTSDEQKIRINKAIKTIGRRVYVLVEDLDRLTGQEIIEVLKLIDGNGDFSNTIFVTAYDKVYVNEVLKNYLAPSVSQDYTDKYFNYEYTLPAPTRFALKAFFSDYLKENIEQDESDLLSQSQMLDVWEGCSDYVIKNLRTLRHIKRFINLFMSRYPRVKNDVDLKDYIYVTLLRYTDVRTYSAICEGKLLKRGGSMNDSKKILYQSDIAEKVLESIGAKESTTEILNMLFPEKGSEGTLEEAYNRAKWADNTDRYFFDYAVKSLPYAKGCRLFSIDDDKDAFALVDEYLQEGYSQPLSDFLRSRKPSTIANSDGLCRLVKLIAYLDNKDRTPDIDVYLMRLLYEEVYKDYERAGIITSREQYKNVIDAAMTFMLDYAPLEIGFLCIRMIDGIIEKQLSEQDIIFAMEELIHKAEWAQKYYYQKWGTDGFSFESALHVSAIKVNPKSGSEGYSHTARIELLSTMELYPDEFAKNLITCTVFEHNGRMLSIGFLQAFKKYAVFPIDNLSFEDWIDAYITNEKSKYVLKAVNKNDTDFLYVKALNKEYAKGDFDGMYEAIKTDADEKLDMEVVNYIKNHLGVDLSMISHFTKKTISEVKESIGRLTQRKDLSSWYEKLKEKMDEFRVGDFVSLSVTAFNEVEKSLIYSNNIFRIEAIDQSTGMPFYQLDGVEKKFSPDEIEAIPIDAIHDRDIYFDPIIAASFVAPGQPIPVHRTDYSYYMEKFERCSYEGKTYSELVKEANCQFVHEVQHYLNEEFGSCELKIYHKVN